MQADRIPASGRQIPRSIFTILATETVFFARTNLHPEHGCPRPATCAAFLCAYIDIN